MSQLSKYIQKQLATLLNRIQHTPPKKSSSMKKIKTLIYNAPLDNQQKIQINRSIRKIQSAMNISQKIRKNAAKSQYAKNLFYENMFLQQKNLNTQHYSKPSKLLQEQRQTQYPNLLQKYQQLRSLRLKRQSYLNQLIIKTQRMERLISLKHQNQQKYLQSKKMQEKIQKKKKVQQNIKRSLKQAVKKNKPKEVYSIIQKYNNFLS